ncbi:MAG: polysaccharide biosynthesis tyrosine autokinase [Micrococcus sp.]|nr:polysaccharide biosynthesis tyrosine autokinase [Micrococcus sp.]
MATDAPANGENTISFSLLWRVVRKRWMVILAGLLVGLLLGALTAFAQPTKYRADAVGVVWVPVTQEAVALAADNLALSKAKQYVQLANSRAVADRAVEILDEDMTPSSALAATNVTNPSQTAQLNISAEAGNPEQARDLAEAWLEATAAAVDQLERPRNSTGEDSAIRINTLIEPDVPTSPSSPNMQRSLMFGAAAGLFLGFLAAFLVHVIDRRIRSVEDLSQAVDLPILATIPRRAKAQGDQEHRTLVGGSSASELTGKNRAESFRLIESFKVLRTNIEFSRPDSTPRIITVTSSVPGEGKSSVAMNLSATLAESDYSVILIDADLRKPVVAKALGLVGEVGLTTVMKDPDSLPDAVQFLSGYDHFGVLAAGAIPPNPAELLGSDRFKELLASLAEEFDYVIVDSPPLGPVIDAATLANAVDGFVLVVELNSTTSQQVTSATRTLERVGAEVLGLVANKAAVQSRSSEYAYYAQED